MEYKFTTANFDQEVLASHIPVMVDFYADWCGPCKMMGPVVEKMAEKFAGKVKIGKLNVDDEGAIAQKYREAAANIQTDNSLPLFSSRTARWLRLPWAV